MQPRTFATLALMSLHPAPQEQDLDSLAAFLKAAGDPLRLEVLQVLGQNSFGVLELCEIMAIKQSGMSHHLKVLAQGGLVERRREGNSIFYRRRLPPPQAPTERLHAALFEELDGRALDAGTGERLTGVQAQRAAQSRTSLQREMQLIEREARRRERGRGGSRLASRGAFDQVED